MTTAAHVWEAMKLPPWRFVLSRWPWRALVYLVLSVLIGAALIPLVIFTFLLLPFWALVLGALERRRTSLLGFAPQPSAHTTVDASERHHWINIRLTERATWRETLALAWDLLFALIALIVLFFETVTLLALGMVAVAGITGPTPTQFFGDAEGVMTPTNWWPVALITLVILVLFGYINACLATGQSCVLRLLCGPHNRAVDANVQRLLNSRRALAESSDAERRRIERDLHDGVQQELIALGARLGMIGLEVDELAARGTDTTHLLRAVDEAQLQAEHAMSTLRDTVRGIHPSVLTDYGLRAALEELAERSNIRVTLEGNPRIRVPAAYETTAYYLVAEALTNIAKHASASSAVVGTGADGKSFIVTVSDNGTGGADERAGTGLRGLSERAEALNGRLRITSPAGGPTVLRMELPLPNEGDTSRANTGR
ncbi:sensor histidine kinase [Microbacterium sp. Ag1]|uniref:sensor histidine kinase n=1 Tax=Microbacterium sp. Ag1 TaxID=1643443 RepID=UPI00069BCD48|nr:sensor histidine kinase [Microbacterium sp. Ag1]